MGIKIGDERLNNQRFADGVLFSESANELINDAN